MKKRYPFYVYYQKSEYNCKVLLDGVDIYYQIQYDNNETGINKEKECRNYEINRHS